jgi:hypothetical protein
MTFEQGGRRNHQEMERPPYRSYATIMATFAGGLAAAGLLGRALGRDPQCHSALDFAVLSAASFKTARTLSRDQVTSFPFGPGTEMQSRLRSRSVDRDRGLGRGLAPCSQ